MQDGFSKIGDHFEKNGPMTLGEFRTLTIDLADSVLIRAYEGESTGVVLETEPHQCDVGFIEARGGR